MLNMSKVVKSNYYSYQQQAAYSLRQASDCLNEVEMVYV